MAKIKFHLDENITLAIANGLRRRGIDITTTPEEGMIWQSDEQQLAFSLSQERVIFTQDYGVFKTASCRFVSRGYCLLSANQ